MPKKRTPTLSALDVVRSAGLDADGPSVELLARASELHALAVNEPERIAGLALRARLDADGARREASRAAAVADEMREAFEALLERGSLLARVEHVRRDDEGGPARALCRVNGQVRELRVHPDLPAERLEGLLPWHYAEVLPDEMVVVGVFASPELYPLAQGELVEFLAWQDPERGLVRVARREGDEAIVRLAPDLRGRELAVRTRLILQRDDERWAIGVAAEARTESRFELPVERITTRFSDLAGLEAVQAELIEDVLLELAHPEECAEAGVAPVRGVLMHSAPGCGKTALARATVAELAALGREHGFDVLCWCVPPNAFKSHWHGGDARRVRELARCLRERAAAPRARPLVQVVLLDELDSIGRRAGGSDGAFVGSSAHNEAVQSLLAEMDGVEGWAPAPGAPAARVLWIGTTNRIDLVDEALRRPGRFERVIEMPALTREAAEAVLAVHARHPRAAWYLGGEVRTGVAEPEVRARVLRPAVARVFGLTALSCSTDGRRDVEVRAGELLVGAHYAEAMRLAKRAALVRRLDRLGPGGIGLDDVVGGLLDQVVGLARQLERDRVQLARVLGTEQRVQRVQPVPSEDLGALALAGPEEVSA